jgi:hopanoid-associated phosphorylase
MADGVRPHRQHDTAAAMVVAVCGLAFEAAIAAGPGVVTLCGLGSAAQAARLDALLTHLGRACRGVISFGTAGGLDPALQPGTCVIAERVVTPDMAFPVDAGWLAALRACLPAATLGTIAGVDHPAADIAAKARLWRSSGACAVDMESHHAALLAQRHGLPFAACRVIVDHAYTPVPAAALLGIHADGTVALSRLLTGLARHPGQLPGCIRLAFDAAAARRSLRAVRLAMGASFALPELAGNQRFSSLPITDL